MHGPFCTILNAMPTRRHNLLLKCAAVIAAALPVVISAQAVQRSLYVSAVDRSGAPVPNLGPSDFVVREDKVAREVLNVGPADDPMQIALLVDNSQAAEPFIRDYREALTAFITTMTDRNGPKNEMSLITLAERPTIVSDYTTDPAQLLKGAQRIFSQPGSGTYLLDGIIEVSRGIMKHKWPRPTIVAIVSEGPELSDRQFEQVLTPLRDSEASFHLIVVGRPSNQDHDRSVVLSEGTRSTGGRYDTVLLSNALTTKLREVARDLKNQYRVTYSRPRTLIPPERITVSTPKPGVTVRGTPAPADREQVR